ncbi:L-ribulose-5-phosphate 3-epimerase [Bifidobacterium sp. ESL0732]|uniref:L-ribulose-5-phosphate 3-epimerase n=1 Tax=Bifidobacterium sp. ESL0732 TaxID=2983222 RepID=UPI0023F817A8|nr:L-ribulose-5-phosphate 3-epimerase [Bifidobacterium sp. ESL0732]WEV64675.1 L-ribulose-5-phosphate 3-epimerase [Bifidobacterium sp. ESL0732]
MKSTLLGIYEKALDSNQSWDGLFAQVREFGFDFMDISIDESEKRMLRLYTDAEDVRRIRRAAERENVLIGGVCLSAHRRFSLGSPIKEHEVKACDLLFRSIDFAKEVGASVVQLAGYYTFYDAHDEYCRPRFMRNLAKGVRYAAKKGVMLAIENVDGQDLTDLHRITAVLDEIGSPWLQAYPDIGNSFYNSCDVVDDLRAAEGRIVALHAKDVLPGKARKVPFGKGIVDFDKAFAELKRQHWSGRVMIEMWNDDVDVDEQCVQAKSFVEEKLDRAGL